MPAMSPTLQHNGVEDEGSCVSSHQYQSSITNQAKERNITVRKVSEVASMNFNRKSITVVGITLADERVIAKNIGNTESRNVVLGVICIEYLNINVEELRRLMCSELPSLPASFTFLTKEGWPVLKQQERLVKTSHLLTDKGTICIKKQFEKHRIGVVAAGGEPIGFIFIDVNCNVRQIREAVEQQLKISNQIKAEYRFIERNGWPVMLPQETMLTLMDIILGHNVCIQHGDKYNTPVVENTRPVSLHGINTFTTDNRNAASQDVTDGEPVNRKKSIKFLRPENQTSVKTGKESEKRNRLLKDDLAKPLLISYVRAEAAQYALDLKKELVQMGFSVYLDVHEIKTGTDWQDALNFAVTYCFIFVPLITPMYGKTQWTNREEIFGRWVKFFTAHPQGQEKIGNPCETPYSQFHKSIKLADVLSKVIIPINFMEQWPPACLAIQFASTQYIPWKTQDIDHEKSEPDKPSDPRHWDLSNVKRVSRQIAECYKENSYKLTRRHPSNSKDIIQQMPRQLFSAKEDYSKIRPVDDSSEISKQIIVISAHPKQRYLAQEMKALFELDGYQVWCSIDLQELPDNLYIDEGPPTNPNTPRDLPTIPEGEVFFSQNDPEAFVSLGETKRSINANKQEPEAYGRRPLSRLMSQFSDISQVSSLTKDKLERLRTFQQMVDKAAVVIVLVSEAYTKSTFSHQQVFYCEHRKRVVLVKSDSGPIPKWFRLLMGNDMIMRVNNPQFECVLKARVKRALNPASSETPKDATAEAKMNYLVNFLKKNLPLQDMCVYIAGSSKLQTQRAEEICKAIGRELAKMARVSLVTGGFYGSADITAKTFCEYRENSSGNNTEDSSVVHILPMHDSEDLTSKARQNPDGSFETVPYGKTVFLGDSVKERETVVARLLDTCIVIEGGPGVVHEVEEFIWNDHFVIPIISTGGAAGGQYGVPVKIFEIPPGVDETDWSVLSEKCATPEEVAKAVVNIMFSLKKALASPVNTLMKSSALFKHKSRKKSKSKKCKVLEEQTDSEDIDISPDIMPRGHSHSVGTMRSAFAISDVSELSHSSSDDQSVAGKKSKWWQKFLQFFRPS